MRTILITGAAGFIGFHASRQFLAQDYRVIGLDNLNDYYDPDLKQKRLTLLNAQKNFTFYKGDITRPEDIAEATQNNKIDSILHLAAQAGVRYSLENPHAYVNTNLLGHLNVLEYARHNPEVKHVVYASSSSVYGERAQGAFRETDTVRTPNSLYAATKIGGEMLAESYAQLYKIPQTGLRFFTVYGPWGRPDMAYFIFTEKMLAGETIELYAPDIMHRDFTYVDDIVSSLPRIVETPARTHEIYNLGNSKPCSLIDLVKAIEDSCGRKAKTEILPRQKGDVGHTFASIEKARAAFDFAPRTSLQSGIITFVDWYKAHHRHK